MPCTGSGEIASARGVNVPVWDIINVIPPVASTAGESRKLLGGGHPRVAPFAFNIVCLKS